MKNKIPIWSIIVVLIIGFTILKQCETSNDKKFKDKIEVLETERQSLSTDNKRLEQENDSLKKRIKKKESQLFLINRKLGNIVKQQNEVPIYIGNYTESELDSILSNYRHPKGK